MFFIFVLYVGVVVYIICAVLCCVVVFSLASVVVYSLY